MSSKIWRSLVAMRAAAKSPAYSASATNEQTTGIRVEWAEMGWLRVASSSVSPKMLRPPATLPARGRERYDASDRQRSTIPEARNICGRWGVRQHNQGGGPVVSWCQWWVKPAPRPGHKWRAGSEGPRRVHSRAGIL